MTDWICKEVRTDNGGYFEPVKELIRCKDCRWQGNETECPMFDPKMMKVDDFCSCGERR